MPFPCRSCRFCHQAFEPSKFRPDQSVCGQPACQRQRRAEYHRRKIETDPVYAQVVNDSQKKWRDAHPDYQKAYRQSHAAAVERNRQMQPGRDGKRRAQFQQDPDANAPVIAQRLKPHGYDGGFTIVKDYLRTLRKNTVVGYLVELGRSPEVALAMRAHFIICPNRPAASHQVDRRWRNPKAKRGRT